MRVEEGFHLAPFSELHPYSDDPVIPNLLKRIIPASIHSEIDAELIRFGNDIRDYIRTLSPLVHPPELTQYDQWGRRIDRLHTSEGWRKLREVAVREGLVAIAHERMHGEHSRLYGFAKVMIFAGDSHTIMCPMSMTDGAARGTCDLSWVQLSDSSNCLPYALVLELHGTEEMKRDIRSRLISRDPSFAFTSGQWMTERPGGSDVSQTETTAISLAGSDKTSSAIGTPFSLNGFKWFSSATDSEIAVALARTGPSSLGSRSLSLFLVPLRLPLLPGPTPASASNGILVHRLKNKFGTHPLPTAELSLNNTEAYLLSPLNEGVRCIAPVLNITRLHSAVELVGSLGRAFAIARSYATVRSITVSDGEGGTRVQRSLKDTPLHMSVLANVGTVYHALTHLTFGAVALLGKSECRTSNRDEEARLRLLTPAVKAFVSDKAVTAMEECMGCLGGQGYMEENVIGRLVRDCSVDRIWEGTISVLALDLIRASRGNQGVASFIKWARNIMASVPLALKHNNLLDDTLACLKLSVGSLPRAFEDSVSSPFVPRPLLFLFAYTAAALYLLEHAVWAFNNDETTSDKTFHANVFKRWTEEGLDAAYKTMTRAQTLTNFGGQANRKLGDRLQREGNYPTGQTMTDLS